MSLIDKPPLMAPRVKIEDMGPTIYRKVRFSAWLVDDIGYALEDKRPGLGDTPIEAVLEVMDLIWNQEDV